MDRLPSTERDEHFMRLALQEARKGVGRTSPNPAVGAVIVRENRVLARGYHHGAGQPHAEIEALRALASSEQHGAGQPHAEIEALRALASSEQARGATIYVTLEPCSTHGRTPPCTDAILAAGLARVVIGAIDPNPHHAGRARTLLESRGIQVTEGVLGAECCRLNRGFNRWIVTGSPWVIAKAAITLDGRITRPPGEGQWLSGPAARAHVHRLRAGVDAILIGAGTLRADNPRLTIRDVPPDDLPSNQPWRVVLSRSGNLPASAHLFTDEHKDRTLVFRDRTIPDVLHELGRHQITSVMIEGGRQILEQFFAAGLVDEVWFYLTPILAGGDDGILNLKDLDHPIVENLHLPRYVRIDNDVFLRGEVARHLSPTGA